jgi:hypothetical protein
VEKVLHKSVQFSHRPRLAETPNIIRRVIADLRTQGCTSLSAIAAGLNDKGIKAPRGGEWRAGQVRQMLSRIPHPLS